MTNENDKEEADYWKDCKWTILLVIIPFGLMFGFTILSSALTIVYLVLSTMLTAVVSIF